MNKILTGNQIHIADGPIVMETVFGWIIFGDVRTNEECYTSVNSVQAHDVDEFWKIENLGINMESSESTEEEKIWAEHFKSTIRQKNDGRYEVSLPGENVNSSFDSYYFEGFKTLILVNQ